jgi:hypothetical protein
MVDCDVHSGSSNVQILLDTRNSPGIKDKVYTLRSEELMSRFLLSLSLIASL